MASTVFVSGLNDAYALLNNARTLPQTPNGKTLIDTYSRAVVLFSWIALEEIVRHEYRERTLTAPSPKLWTCITDLLANRPAPLFASFDASKGTFLARREVRNSVVHSLETAAAISLNDAEEAFTYCKTAVEAISRYRLEFAGSNIF